MSIKATIIIPVYNTQKYLRKCLDSVLNQDYDNYDVICINDCSPDDSQAILDEYSQKYSDKITVIMNEKNIGQGQSRMKAVNTSNADYVLFVDSDDYIDKDYIKTFVEATENGRYDLVIAGHTRDVEGKLSEVSVVNSDLNTVCYAVACCKAFKRAFIISNKIDFTDKRAGEDIYFNTAVFCSDALVKTIDYYGYYYYLNNSSTTRSLNYDRKFEVIVSDMFSLLLDKYPVSEMTEAKRIAIEYSYAANMINALINYGHGCKPKMMREKYNFFINDLKKKFPDYKRNPYFKTFRLVGPTKQNTYAVVLTMKLMKLHMAWPMYWIISLKK